MSTSRRMPLVAALETIHALRREQIVITSMGTAREWPRISQHLLDFHFAPSTMGGAVPLGLGMALAMPDREVFVFSGDGSLLMSLGSLITVVAADVENLTIFCLDNGVYEVTGGQATAAALARADLTGIARAAGIRSVVAYGDLAAWRVGAAATLRLPGPRFVLLRVQPELENYQLDVPGPISQRLEAFLAALARDPAE